MERAWEEFHRAYRQYLVDAAGDVEIADQIIAELYGGQMARFHGRASLKGWLRAVVWQAQVDRHRRESRLTPLEEFHVEHSREDPPESFEQRENAAALAAGLRAEVAGLQPEQRLLLAWYYVDRMRLAQIARFRGVHESTISRELEAVRKQLRQRVEKRLRADGFSAARVAECFERSTDAAVDLEEMLAGKKSPLERT